MTNSNDELVWHRVAALDELPSGRVKTVTAGTLSMALTNIDGEFSCNGQSLPAPGRAIGRRLH